MLYNNVLGKESGYNRISLDCKDIVRLCHILIIICIEDKMQIQMSKISILSVKNHPDVPKLVLVHNSECYIYTLNKNIKGADIK